MIDVRWIAVVAMVTYIFGVFAVLLDTQHYLILKSREWKPTAFKEFPPEQMKAPEPIGYERIEK